MVSRILGACQYYDQELPTGEYKVGFYGNGYTGVTSVMGFALLRCAELTIEKGNNYFEIVQGGYDISENTYWTDFNGYEIVSYSSLPSAEYIIRLHDSEPEDPEGKVFNALQTKQRITKRQQTEKQTK